MGLFFGLFFALSKYVFTTVLNSMNTDQLKNQSFFDLGNLDSIRKEALQGAGDKNASDQALEKAAKQFESIFTQMLLKSMRKANEALEDKDSPFNSSGVKFFEEMHDQQLAMHLSEKGSLDLADLIVQQLSPSTEGFKPASVLRGDTALPTRSEAKANTVAEPKAEDRTVASSQTANEQQASLCKIASRCSVPASGGSDRR